LDYSNAHQDIGEIVGKNKEYEKNEEKKSQDAETPSHIH
jgi:hypothetical protein